MTRKEFSVPAFISDAHVKAWCIKGGTEVPMRGLPLAERKRCITPLFVLKSD